MERVIVTVRMGDDAKERDLEVPASIEAGRLADMIVAVLCSETGRAGSTSRYEVLAYPLGRTLKPSESLSDAGVWDGSLLILQPARERTAKTHVACLRSEGGREYALQPPDVVIGRRWSGMVGSGRHERFLDLGEEPAGKTVSRTHAYLVLTGGVWALIPAAKTTNPTLVNSVSIEPNHPCSLAEGDSIQLGRVKLSFHWRT